MAEIRESVEVSRQKAHNAILEMLGCIKEQSQDLFSDQLKHGFQPPNLDDTPFSPGFYYLGEVDRRWWLGPWWLFRRKRLLLVVKKFDKEKGINCHLFEKSILDIVKEEVQKVAEAFDVPVRLNQRFAD